MRDYAKVAPQFWTGKTGKALKAAGPEAVIVGMYLMTSPHANMIGLYHCPLTYIAYDTGLTFEGASKGLASCSEALFCTYDDASEYVFVHEFAIYQIGEELDPKDNRVKGIVNELAKVPKGKCWQGFRARYAVPFHLPIPTPPAEAPSKPLRSQKQKQEQEQKKKKDLSAEPTVPCPYESIVQLYHDALPDLPAVRLMDDERQKAMRKLWGFVLSSRKPDGSRRAENAEQAIAWVRDYFVRAAANDFLMGRTQRTGEHAGWRCDFDFLLTVKGMKHVIEKTQAAA